MSSSVKLVLTRRFAAEPSRVFDACSQANLLLRWLGPDGFEMLDVVSDFRVGGRFSFRMRGEQGVFGAEGTYTEIIRNERIELTWRWTEGPAQSPPDGVVSRVTYEFAADAKGTLFTLTHEQLPDRKQVDEHSQGWNEALMKLRALVDS